MKKMRILFCGLLVGLSVSSYLIATPKSSLGELFLLNVEALSFDESIGPDCVVLNGYCIADNGNFIRGMAFKH